MARSSVVMAVVARRAPAVGVSALLLLPPVSSAGGQRAEAAPALVWRVDEEARGIPVRDRDSAYFLTHRHEVVAADLATGRVRWRALTDSTGPTFGSRVVVHDDVVVAGDYGLVGFDRRAGRRLWEFVPSDGGGAGMHLGGTAGGLAFTGSLAGSLHAVDMATGRPRWSTVVGDPSTTTVYAPIVHNRRVAATFTDFGPEPAGGVIVVDAETGHIRWRRIVPGSIGASGNPVFAGDVLIAAARDGTIHAFDARTGEPAWMWPSVERIADEQDYRPLAVSGRFVVAGSLSGEVVAHDVVTRRVLWRRAPTIASVAFDILAADSAIVVPYLSNQIVAFRVHDGAELWRLGGGVSQFRWVPFADNRWLLASGSRSLSLFRRGIAVPERR